MVTDRDVDIVSLLDDSGGLDARCVMLAFGLGQTVAYRRLGQLIDHGMVEAVRPFARTPALYLPTTQGLRDLLGREDLAPPSVSMSSYNHQVEVGRVIAELRLHGVPWESSRITRRRQLEAREAGDRQRERRFAIKLSWQQRWHLPDVIVWPSRYAVEHDRPVALEVELTQKTKARLDEILSGYDLHPDFAGVVYICGGRSARNAVARAAERATAHGARPIAQTTTDQFGRHLSPSADPWIARFLTGGELSAVEAYFAAAPSARRAQLALEL